MSARCRVYAKPVQSGMLVLFIPPSQFTRWQRSVVILMRLELYRSTHKVTDSLLSTQNRPNLMTLIWSLLGAQSLATRCRELGGVTHPPKRRPITQTSVYCMEYLKDWLRLWEWLWIHFNDVGLGFSVHQHSDGVRSMVTNRKNQP